MPQRSGLGKGLDALIPGNGTVSSDGGIAQVAIDSIQRNPRQPRQSFKEDELEELAASIREHGIIQPLIIAPAVNGTFTLIAGERRLQAARRAGLRNVPVVIRNATDQQLLELALIENVQRADLNPIEEAEAFHHLIKEFGLSQEAGCLTRRQEPRGGDKYASFTGCGLYGQTSASRWEDHRGPCARAYWHCIPPKHRKPRCIRSSTWI